VPATSTPAEPTESAAVVEATVTTLLTPPDDPLATSATVSALLTPVLPTATPQAASQSAASNQVSNTSSNSAANQLTAKPKPLATATAVPASAGPGAPTRLRIPAIGVNAAIEYVTTAADGTMDIPKNEWNVAWYRLGYVPGTPGNAVIDGHLDWIHGPAVFWNLAKLKPGNAIYVKDKRGVERTFIVTEVVAYPFDQAPLDRIFGASSTAQLNLITCNGQFDKSARNYNKRLVVYSTLSKLGLTRRSGRAHPLDAPCLLWASVLASPISRSHAG